MKKVKLDSRLFGVILGIFVLVAAVPVRFFMNEQQVNAGHYEALLLLREAHEVDSKLVENVLRTHSLMLDSYDPLVKYSSRLEELCQTFSRRPDFVFKGDPLKAATVSDFCSAVRAKSDKVDRFKSSHSVLKNSLQYFPYLVGKMQGTRFDESSDHLMIYILRFYLDPTEENLRTLEDASKWIETAGRDRKLAPVAESLRRHLGTIISMTKLRTSIEAEVLSARIASATRRVEAAYLDAFRVTESRMWLMRWGLLAVCAGLAVGLATILNRLRYANESLEELTTTLEKKVDARTADLSRTMGELSRNQEALTQTAKMSALGEMAGGIAHEINTPLGAILLQSESLQAKAAQDRPEELVAGLRSIDQTVHRISRIVTGLRKFSRSGAEVPVRPYRVREIIDDTLILCQEKFRNLRIEIDLAFGPDAEGIEALCIPERVSQALLNLLNNARDATEGQVSRWVRIEVARLPAHAEISVTDSGGGIPEAIRQKLMQPFFTTKAIGVGTGLGLSISKGLLESQRGSLEYDSTSRNTRFVMRLPIFDEYPLT